MAPVLADPLQGPCGRQCVECTTPQSRAMGEVLGAGESAAAFTCRHQRLRRHLRQSAHLPQAQTQGWSMRVRWLQRAIPVAGLHVHRQHGHPLPPRLVNNLRRAVETERLTVEQRRSKRRRVVALKPSRRVDQQCEARSVALGKAIAAESFDLLKQAVGKIRVVTTLGHASLEPALEMPQTTLLLPSRHGAAQLVGLAGGETSGDHSQLHHLLLEDRHTQGALQDVADVGRRVGHRLLALLAAQIGMHHPALDRPRSNDCNLDDQVVEGCRLEPRQHVHLRPRLDLEHAQTLAALQHGVGRRTLGREGVQRQLAATPVGM